MSRIYQHRKLLLTYDTIIFDLDGTLYDSDLFYTGVFLGMARWLIKTGFQKRPDPWVDCLMGLKRAKGNDYKKLIDDGLTLLKIDVAVKKQLLKIYREHNCKGLVLDSNETTVLDELKKYNKQLFIITNGQRKLQEQKVNCLGLNHYMKEIIILDLLEDIALKPDAASFNYLSEKYNLGHTIMVGDRFDIDGVFAQHSDIDFLGVGFHGN